MVDSYMDARRDMDRIRKLFRRLHFKKEKEIALRKIGKRLPASEVKEMREMEATIVELLETRKRISNSQQRSLFENLKSRYQAGMRGWRNRLAFAEQQRARRRRARGMGVQER